MEICKSVFRALVVIFKLNGRRGVGLQPWKSGWDVARLMVLEICQKIVPSAGGCGYFSGITHYSNQFELFFILYHI